MSAWLLQFALGSVGLALTALATAVVLHGWRHRPVASYRLASAVLAAVLLLPAAQLLSGSMRLPFSSPLRSWLADWSLSAEAGVPAEELLAPVQFPSTRSLSPELLALGGDSRPRPLGLAPSARPATLTTLERDEPATVTWLPWLLLVYALGLAASLLHTGRRLWSTFCLVRASRPVRDERTLAIWRTVLAPSPLAGRARLVASERVLTPACSGLFTPVVVLPEEEDFSTRPEVLECVLAHELVHLERRDAWIQLGEELLRALFWFHPAAWWLRARLERLREVSCDLLVVQRTGKRRRYAAALLEYATWMQSGVLGPARHGSSTAAVVPWSTSKGQLTRRIEMLLRKEPKTNKLARWVAPVAVGSLFSLLWGGQLALAAGTNPAHDPDSSASHEGSHDVRLVTKDGKKILVVERAAKDGQERIAFATIAKDASAEHEPVVIDLTQEGANVQSAIATVRSSIQGQGTSKFKVVQVRDGVRYERVYVVDSQNGEPVKVSEERHESKSKSKSKTKVKTKQGGFFGVRGNAQGQAPSGSYVVRIGEGDRVDHIVIESDSKDGSKRYALLTTDASEDGGGQAGSSQTTRWLFRDDGDTRKVQQDGTWEQAATIVVGKAGGHEVRTLNDQGETIDVLLSQDGEQAQTYEYRPGQDQSATQDVYVFQDGDGTHTYELRPDDEGDAGHGIYRFEDVSGTQTFEVRPDEGSTGGYGLLFFDGEDGEQRYSYELRQDGTGGGQELRFFGADDKTEAKHPVKGRYLIESDNLGRFAIEDARVSIDGVEGGFSVRMTVDADGQQGAGIFEGHADNQFGHADGTSSSSHFFSLTEADGTCQATEGDGEGGAWVMLGDDTDAEHASPSFFTLRGATGEVDATKDTEVNELEAELAKTRALLEAQRAELEALERKLEKLHGKTKDAQGGTWMR